MNAPNAISLLRLFSVPALVWLILEGFGTWAFWLFVAAVASDAADGFLAKQFDMATDLGRYLDPIADKVLIVSVYLIFGHVGSLPSWLVILVVTRDTMIIGGSLLTHTLGQGVQIRPLLLSKINTVAQMFLAAFVLAKMSFIQVTIFANNWVNESMIIWLIAVTTLSSGTAYLIRWSLSAPEQG